MRTVRQRIQLIWQLCLYLPTSQMQEYGLPSSHTMNSICMNLYIVHYLYDRGLLSTPVAGGS